MPNYDNSPIHHTTDNLVYGRHPVLEALQAGKELKSCLFKKGFQVKR